MASHSPVLEGLLGEQISVRCRPEALRAPGREGWLASQGGNWGDLGMSSGKPEGTDVAQNGERPKGDLTC